MKIKEEVLKVLSNCRVEGNKVFLPNTQLDRKLYVETNKTLESLNLKWNRSQKCHISDNNVEENFEDMILTGEYSDKKKELNYFPTPLNIVKQMIELAELHKNDVVLESSAGQGVIIDEVSKITNGIILFEIDKNNCEILRNKGYKVNEGDFLDTKYLDGFHLVSKVIQNPPFHIKNRPQCDLDFVYHSFSLLKNGGILVSIVSESSFFRSNVKSIEFRDWLEKNNAEIIKLPDNSFTESGTNVKTRIIKVKKI